MFYAPAPFEQSYIHSWTLSEETTANHPIPRYIAMICAEILTIYFFYPETYGRTLEELSFRKSPLLLPSYIFRIRD